MANTLIQIKRSSGTAVPTSLQPGELAYSFNSDKVFIGNTTNISIAIGGKYFVDYQNTLAIIASAAYDKANAANVLAYNTGIGANAYADYVSAASNGWANTVVAGSNAWTNTVFGYSNTYAQTVGAASNGWANTVGTFANAYADSVGVAANNYANVTFLKLTGGTINGDLNVSGNLTLTGNTTFINVATLVIDDSLLYLAANNYTSDLIDIGFVANYVNATGYNVHTGVFRDAGSKEYYVFEGYDEEPHNNVIDPNGNNFTIAVLNATLRTSNVILNGANLWSWVNNAYSQANAAPGISNSYAVIVGAASNNWANTVGTSANAYADAVGIAANTNAANASYLSTGTVSSDRISGAYSGITGVGTIASGTWNGNTVTVPYGGTGETSFTANGILYGNTTGALKVTAAGTDGQVLQSDQGLPKFAMLDGGVF